MVATMPSMHDSNSSVQSATTRANNKTIVCTICSAQYAPTQAHAYLLQSPRLALESAFMSMCHFCFRCRRPACPLCWDNVHGLCGACVEDVHLPFRQEAEPLPLKSQLLVPVSPRPQQHRTPTFPLVCTQPGRFQADVALVEANERPAKEPVLDVQEPREIQEPSAQDDAMPMVISRNDHVEGIARRIERIMTWVLALILFIIAVLIVAASFSAQANEVIVHLLHVDIRMEIGYLLQLIQQLHSGG